MLILHRLAPRWMGLHAGSSSHMFSGGKDFGFFVSLQSLQCKISSHYSILGFIYIYVSIYMTWRHRVIKIGLFHWLIPCWLPGAMWARTCRLHNKLQTPWLMGMTVLTVWQAILCVCVCVCVCVSVYMCLCVSLSLSVYIFLHYYRIVSLFIVNLLWLRSRGKQASHVFWMYVHLKNCDNKIIWIWISLSLSVCVNVCVCVCVCVHAYVHAIPHGFILHCLPNKKGDFDVLFSCSALSTAAC